MAPSAIPPFRPLRWASGPHAQTILGRYWNRHPLPGTDESHEIPLEDGDRLVALLRHRPTGASKAVVFLFHGLGGSTDSDYIPRTADVFAREGYTVIMANHRGCGPGAGLAAGPYHSGSAGDLAAVIAWGRRLFPEQKHVAIGFSLSGNALLLLLGARQELAQPDAAISVNAPIDLARAALLLGRGRNRLYDLKFVQDARHDIEARRAAGLLRESVSIPPWATLVQVDDLYTAPQGGFRDRHDYYARCSAGPHLSKIRVPTVALTAADDPFVDVRAYRQAELSPMVRLHIEEHGGHMGFLAHEPTELGSRHWLDLALLRHCEQMLAKR